MTEVRFVGPFDRLLYLKQLPGLTELSFGELAVLARQLSERHFTRGEKLLTEGTPIDTVFITVEGTVRMEKDGLPEGLSGPQQGVGFIHWLANVEDGVDATAETDVLALEMPTAALLEILEDHFSFYLTMMRTFARLVYDQLQMTADGTVKRIWESDLILPDRPLDLVERIVLIRRAPIMKDVGLETIANIASYMTEKQYEAGSQLWKTGDAAEGLVIVLSGRIRCSLPDRGTHFFAESGYPMGNIESLALKPRWYDAIAETPTTVLEGESTYFLDALEDHFDMAMTFLRSMADGYLNYLRQNQADQKIETASR